MRETVPTNATYFREYGIHPVKQQDGNTDYIASFPTWEATEEALKTDFPDSGNIITPEYLTAPEDITTITGNKKLIDRRIRSAIKLTEGSNATLHLGTPTHRKDIYGNRKWFNSALSIRNGAIESATHKQTLLPAERSFGMEEPTKDERMVKTGNAILICAELFLYSMDPNNRLKGKNVKQIFAPTMWAHPAIPGQNLNDIQKAGGEDNYYRQQLETAVGSYLFRNMPTVNRVVISDRGRPNLAPYNAVIDRVR